MLIIIIIIIIIMLLIVCVYRGHGSSARPGPGLGQACRRGPAGARSSGRQEPKRHAERGHWKHGIAQPEHIASEVNAMIVARARADYGDPSSMEHVAQSQASAAGPGRPLPASAARPGRRCSAARPGGRRLAGGKVGLQTPSCRRMPVLAHRLRARSGSWRRYRNTTAGGFGRGGAGGQSALSAYSTMPQKSPLRRNLPARGGRLKHQGTRKQAVRRRSRASKHTLA